MEPTKKTNYVEAGCNNCGQQFYLGLDPETGQPIWTHVCPKSDSENIKELLEQVKKLTEKQNGEN